MFLCFLWLKWVFYAWHLSPRPKALIKLSNRKSVNWNTKKFYHYYFFVFKGFLSNWSKYWTGIFTENYRNFKFKTCNFYMPDTRTHFTKKIRFHTDVRHSYYQIEIWISKHICVKRNVLYLIFIVDR